MLGTIAEILCVSEERREKGGGVNTTCPRAVF